MEEFPKSWRRIGSQASLHTPQSPWGMPRPQCVLSAVVWGCGWEGMRACLSTRKLCLTHRNSLGFRHWWLLKHFPQILENGAAECQLGNILLKTNGAKWLECIWTLPVFDTACVKSAEREERRNQMKRSVDCSDSWWLCPWGAVRSETWTLARLRTLGGSAL